MDKERGGEQTERESILQLLGELDLYLDMDRKDKDKEKIKKIRREEASRQKALIWIRRIRMKKR